MGDALILALVVFLASGLAFVIVATVDVLQFPADAWLMSGHRREDWLLQAVGVFVLPLGIVYSGVYFWRIRPRVARARAELEQQRPDHAEWMQRQRWYDRLFYARRSPERWARTARMWWSPWLLAASFLALAAMQASVGRGRSVWAVALPATVALVNVARGGFWYAEHMRLTGRRPPNGGPLRPREPEDRTS